MAARFGYARDTLSSAAVGWTKHDYYEVLGVSRTADEDALRSAYRALARELHPDVSEAPDAEERFRKVTAAYGVLSKPSRRFLYDRFGYRSHVEGGATRILAEVEIDSIEADRGTRREVRFAANDQCALCRGSGAVPGSEVRGCSACGGRGACNSRPASARAAGCTSKTALNAEGSGASSRAPARSAPARAP